MSGLLVKKVLGVAAPRALLPSETIVEYRSLSVAAVPTLIYQPPFRVSPPIEYDAPSY